MDRRDFLLGSGLLLGGGLAARYARELSLSSPAQAREAPPVESWAAVKAEFGLAPGLAHMSGFFLASHPRAVREAIERLRRGLDENPFEFVEQQVRERETSVRAAAAAYGGGQPDELAMTDSTTMGLGLIYGGLSIAAGQEILSTTHDHIATTLACQHRADRGGVTFRTVSLYDEPAKADVKSIVARAIGAIRPETRVLALTWVHSGTGVKLPLRAIADRLAKLNSARSAHDRVLLVVDGVHGFGIEDVRWPDLGCDLFIAGCHKWIFGPRGTGLVWGKPEAWSAVQPIIPSFDPMWRSGPPEQQPRAAQMTPGGFHSFEHRWALDSAFQFHQRLGKARVAARIHALNRHMKQELARIRGVKVITPLADELSAGIVCFSIAGMTPAAVVTRLRAAKILASETPPFYTPAYVRLAAGLLTLEQDVEAALAAVRGLKTA